MKFCLQLNPQVSIDKPAAQLMPTLIEQVRVADAVGFDAFSMGDHYNIPGLQRLNQVPALARLCTENSVNYDGAAFKLKNVSVDPKPLQKPWPPIWIAANSDAAVARAATIGDGWMIGPHSAIDELEHQVEVCRQTWSAAGKPGSPDIPIIRETFVAKTTKEAM